MLNDLSDKEQVALLKKWWRDYGRVITIAVLFGLTLGFGWRYWHQHEIRQSERASLLYAQLQRAEAQHQTDVANQLTTDLMQHYKKTPYASAAALMMARLAVDKKDYAGALQLLQSVILHAKLPSLKQIARIRAARVLLTTKQNAAALKLLATLDDPAYLSLVMQVRGDIYAAMGDILASKNAYQTAQTELQRLAALPELQPFSIDDALLAMKLAN